MSGKINVKNIYIQKIRNVIEKDKLQFSYNNIPDGLTKILSKKDIVMLGENHYIQQHQEFVASLVSALHGCGYRLFVNELMHAYSWCVEDFVLGIIDQIPEEIMFFDYDYLKKIREYNSKLADNEKIKVKYIDVNHWKNNFIRSISFMEKYINTYGIFDKIKEKNLESNDYYNNLNRLLSELLDHEKKYCRKFTGEWFDRIKDIIEIEIISFEQRKNDYNPCEREKIMIKLCERCISDKRKTIINCGSNHTQKKYFSGPGKNYQLIGEFINEKYNSYSIGFSAIKGEIKHNFRDLKNEKFNILKNSREDDLFRLIGEKQDQDCLFIPFDNPIFQNEYIVQDCTSETNIKPKSQYDAYIFYYEISVADSMVKYHYNE
jgi:hypothetical protein